MANLNLIPPRVGFVRLEQNGEYVLSREGFNFLRDMFNRVGGTAAPTNAELLSANLSLAGAAFAIGNDCNCGADLMPGPPGPQGARGEPGPAIFILQDTETEDVFWPFSN